MKLHSNVITYADVQRAGRIARLSFGSSYETVGSRSHARGFEVKLRGNSNRRPNFYNGDGEYAATWDQWGVFLSVLFDVDPDMVAGSVKRPTYGGRDDFHLKTADRFNPEGKGSVPAPRHAAGLIGAEIPAYWPADAHGDHTFRFQGTPRSQGCTKCSATMTWAV